jgi:hypothetical protein
MERQIATPKFTKITALTLALSSLCLLNTSYANNHHHKGKVHQGSFKGESSLHHNYKGDFKGEAHRNYKGEGFAAKTVAQPIYTPNGELDGNQYNVFHSPSDEHPYTRWYAAVGYDDYHINLPTYRLPITFGYWLAAFAPGSPPTTPDKGFNAADTNGGNNAIAPYITIGYNLKNGSTVLPAYLDKESLEVHYGQFNRATKEQKFYTGAGFPDEGAAYGVIWRLNPDPLATLYGFGSSRIVSTSIHASIHYHDLEALLKANVKGLPANLHSTARAGIVVTTLDQFYAYEINSTSQGLTHNPSLTSGDDSVRTRYYGLSLGDDLEYKIAPAFGVFVNAKVQALYATVNLIANQIPDSLAGGVYSFQQNNIRVTDHAKKATYRAQAAGGINFYPKIFKNTTNPLKLSLYAGVDQWGYVPQEEMLTTYAATAPRIVGHSMRNFFFGANITFPII